MINAWRITKIQLLGFFGINKIKHRGSGTDFLKLVGFGLLYLLLGLTIIIYSGGLSLAVIYFGYGDLVPGIFYFTASLVIFIFSILKSSGTLFGLKDYDLLMSLPIRTSSIVIGRVLSIYIGNLLLSAAVILPGMIVYAIMVGGGFFFFLTVIIGIILLPMVPMVVAFGLGALITGISVSFRYKNIVAMVLNIVLLVGLMILSFSLNSGNKEDVETFVNIGGQAILTWYPPAQLFYQAIVDQNTISFLCMIVFSLLIMGLFVGLLSRYYKPINSAIHAGAGRKKYAVKQLKRRSPFGALFIREWKLFVSSTVYAVNSSFGVILLLLTAVVLCVVDPSTLGQTYEIPAEVDLDSILQTFVPFVISIFAAMTSTSAVSLNIEGDRRWILLQLPITAKQIFRAKIAMNLSLIIPPVIFAWGLLAIRFGITGLHLILALLLPVAFGTFISVIGLFFNLLLPKYDWNTEQQAVKQSSSAFITIMLGMVLSMGALCLGIPIYISGLLEFYMIVLIIALLIITLFVYRHISRKQLFL